MRKSNLIILFLLVSFTTGICQFVITPIPRGPAKKTVKTSKARIQSLSPMVLPFWDDFSFSNSKFYPHDSLWEYGQSVAVNLGDGIHPNSLGVATFDGLDSLGRPYNVNDALAKGYADKLVSRTIRLDTLPASQTDSVYLSFFYEPMGNGEVPNPGDHLQLDFKSKDSLWQTVYSLEDDGTLRTDTFNLVIVKVDPSFWHSGFQFRFRNYGRLSGPYDTWQLDYVYLNAHRYSTDTSFPDRALATPMTSLFNEYWDMPKKHFITNVAGNLTRPSFDVYNLSDNIDQPINYTYYAEVQSFQDSTMSTSGLLKLDDFVSLNDIKPQSRLTGTVASTPPVALFDPAADSFLVKLKLGLNSADNKVPHWDSTTVPPTFIPGDYDSLRFGPINFLLNDTTQSSHVLSNYYAYDDGSAEYGIGLNQPGAIAAYFFDMKTPDPDTIVAVDIYFPRFGDESSQILVLSILSDTTNSPQSILYRSTINVDRSEMDSLRRYVLNVNTVGVQNGFYIAWTQNSSASIPMGWDLNTDSGSKIFFNLNGSWEQDSTLHGSIMIRPVFGKGGLVTGLPEASLPIFAYPNPNTGTFYLSGDPEFLGIMDMTGKPVAFAQEKGDHQTRVVLGNPIPGIYIVKTFLNGKYSSRRIMVQP